MTRTPDLRNHDPPKRHTQDPDINKKQHLLVHSSSRRGRNSEIPRGGWATQGNPPHHRHLRLRASVPRNGLLKGDSTVGRKTQNPFQSCSLLGLGPVGDMGISRTVDIYGQ